jgi:hypothetical protein
MDVVSCRHVKYRDVGESMKYGTYCADLAIVQLDYKEKLQF